MEIPSFVGHVGVLIAARTAILFVEKVNFEEPYQAIKFATRKMSTNT